jgi:putative oxygen-independent coproporphyrinogen III oxidase
MPSASSSPAASPATDTVRQVASAPTEDEAPGRDRAGHPGLGVYVHWPFCVSKCPYCDFNSHVREAVDPARWAAALAREAGTAAAVLPDAARQPVTSLFFGGGTPSLMPPDLVEAVIERLAADLGLADDVEITLEANPASADAGRFAGYASAGINRLSLGVQSFDDRVLRFLGRAHDADAARLAIEKATRTFDRVSFDLIYAIPGQSLDDWRDALDAALPLVGGHVSLYQLTIERGTRFFEAHRRKEFTLPDDDTAATLEEITVERCARAGLWRYEVSNYAIAGHACRHNLIYWRSGDWIGIGPGAHGRLGDARAGKDGRPGNRTATARLRSPEKWLEAVEVHGVGTETEDYIDIETVIVEAVMMGLRLTDGLRTADFERLTGEALDSGQRSARLADLAAQGLLIVDPEGIRATPRGMSVLNAVISTLLS